MSSDSRGTAAVMFSVSSAAGAPPPSSASASMSSDSRGTAAVMFSVSSAGPAAAAGVSAKAPSLFVSSMSTCATGLVDARPADDCWMVASTSASSLGDAAIGPSAGLSYRDSQHSGV